MNKLFLKKSQDAARLKNVRLLAMQGMSVEDIVGHLKAKGYLVSKEIVLEDLNSVVPSSRPVSPKPQPRHTPSKPRAKPAPEPECRPAPKPDPKPEAAAQPAPSPQETTGSRDKAVQRRETSANRKIGALNKARDRRRFKSGPVATGEYSKLAQPDATGTIFPTKVQEPDEHTDVLIDGANSQKIGGDVSVGWLAGAHIRTLTLEERATCPKTCPHWRGCYTNAMPWSVRWRHGPGLIAALQRQIPELLEQHERLLVRLHIGGDFYSVEYVAFWRVMLAMHPRLFVFGFTEWGSDTEIGRAVARVRLLEPNRFWVRKSNVTGQWGAFTLPFDTTEKTIGDAIVAAQKLARRALGIMDGRVK